MKHQYYIADVFTREIFNGAQIAVFPRADGFNAHTMALIARELNLTETVFIFHRNNQENYRRMRIFSPYAELNFGGHPLIAAGFVLATCGDIVQHGANHPVVFEQNAGLINVYITVAPQKPTFVQFSRSVKPWIDHFAPTNEECATFLGLPATDLNYKNYTPRMVSCGFPYLVIPTRRYEAVRQACFNYQAWSRSTAPQTAAQEIILFAPKTPHPDADFNVRLFGPRIGIHEDPPVGSAMPSFCAYLCSFPETRLGTQAFSVERGDLDSRRSVINLEMDNKGGETLTVRIGGEAVLVAEGMIDI
jgi:trans-2,3-dihydro-3-hydroxyanthranilate isomerase